MRKTVLTYGLIAGIITSMCMLIMGFIFRGGDPAGFKNSMYVGYTFMALGFILAYPAMVSYRNNVGNGVISFGRALSIALLIVGIGCVCYSITWVIVYKTLMPDFWDKYGQYVAEEMRAKGASADKIGKQAEQIAQYKQMYKNPVMVFLFTLLEPLPIGIPLSLICAAIIKKRKPQPQVV